MLCHAESFRVSRMREIRPSGLMRAEAAALLPLRYSTVILRPRERNVAVVFVVGRCWYHHANESFDDRDRHERVGRHPAPR